MLGDVLAWLADHPQAFETAASRHLALSATALVAAMALALPLALVLVRWHRAAGPVIASVNVLRTIPSLALLAAALPLLGTGFLPAVIALTLYGLPAILINTHTALREVDPDVVEAGLGQGMTGRQVMRRIRIPLGLPVIFAGIERLRFGGLLARLRGRAPAVAVPLHSAIAGETPAKAANG